ncbi:PTS sugar transporter subunit IIB [Pelosinus sp. UFO1]|uniref:PTS sugar transporter subunit IIB n=1 Tax=Pelosinus sp. UFO1 TaxID=484770 RepID=UPI0004D0C3D9|nr:PTS sugar transporter subunit IIB [Pelosinus sp. UFO1]AIF49922.1 phosphotransferase system lactose/cellobiose-specific IIB subunit [Pelosinus sp. UFO1]
MAKRVLVLCGNGVATSTVACKKIQDYMAGAHVRCEVIQAKIGELASYADKVDVIVLMAMGAALPEIANKPLLIKGLPFLTGMGLPETLEQIKQHIQKN